MDVVEAERAAVLIQYPLLSLGGVCMHLSEARSRLYRNRLLQSKGTFCNTLEISKFAHFYATPNKKE